MRVHRVLCLGAGLLLPQLVLAKLPFSNESFGTVEAMLDSCSKGDPAAAAKYEERKKALVANVPKKELTDARATTEYQDAYDATASEIGKQPKEKLVEACTAFLKDGK
jgi:hypothetical protein